MENEKITQTPAPPVLPISPNPSKRLIILVVLFIIAVAGIATYAIALKYAPLPPNFPPQPTPLVVVQPTPSFDSTANWKTYIDPSLGFSFRYPSGGTARKVDADSSVRLSLGGPDLFTVISMPLNGKKLTDVINRNAEIATVAGQILINPTKISVGSFDGYWLRGEREGTQYTYIDLLSQNTNYLEIAYLQNEPIDQARQKTIDQILSTFKFTN